MKRKIGIALLIVLNLIFLFLTIGFAISSYGIIVQSAGEARGLIIVNRTTIKIIIFVSIITISTVLINYVILKKLILNKKPLISSCIFTMTVVLIFIPFLLSERQSFIEFQKSSDLIGHYYDRFDITKAIIITSRDTIEIKNINEFTFKISGAQYKSGLWKYMKTMKIIYIYKNGNKDTIPTNGQIYGPFKGKYFVSEQNEIEKYLREEKSSW